MMISAVAVVGNDFLGHHVAILVHVKEFHGRRESAHFCPDAVVVLLLSCGSLVDVDSYSRDEASVEGYAVVDHLATCSAESDCCCLVAPVLLPVA